MINHDAVRADISDISRAIVQSGIKDISSIRIKRIFAYLQFARILYEQPLFKFAFGKLFIADQIIDGNISAAFIGSCNFRTLSVFEKQVKGYIG